MKPGFGKLYVESRQSRGGWKRFGSESLYSHPSDGHLNSHSRLTRELGDFSSHKVSILGNRYQDAW